MIPHPLLDRICDLYFREGYPFAESDQAIERMRLAFEWHSGQWVMLTDKVNDVLWGWMSWWRVSRELLEQIRTGEIEEHVRSGHPRALLTGPCVYIATTVVAPYAPEGTYRRLFELACSANEDAESVSAHLRKRDGKVRWLHRAFHEGHVCPSAKARISLPASR